jgi:hypothetical protein
MHLDSTVYNQTGKIGVDYWIGDATSSTKHYQCRVTIAAFDVDVDVDVGIDVEF